MTGASEPGSSTRLDLYYRKHRCQDSNTILKQAVLQEHKHNTCSPGNSSLLLSICVCVNLATHAADAISVQA